MSVISQKKARESVLFSTMCSAGAERDASFGRDVWIRRLMRASRESGTHHIILRQSRKTSLCRRHSITCADGANIIIHRLT
jgi:hypothetical protein